MRAIAGPAAPDASVRIRSVLRRGAVLAAGIHFGEIFSKLRCQLLPTLIGEYRWLNSADADCLVFQYAASQQALDGPSLVGREIFGIVNHETNPNYIMTDCIPGLQAGYVRRKGGEKGPVPEMPKARCALAALQRIGWLAFGSFVACPRNTPLLSDEAIRRDSIYGVRGL